jgi:hypothetical protein
MGALVIQCPETGRQIPTGYEVDAASFGRMPVFFSVTFCPICRSDHHWFARDARVLDQPSDDKQVSVSRRAAAETRKRSWAKLDEFVRATNVERYRRMLSESTDDLERQTILKLLSEEMARQKTMFPTERSGPPFLPAHPEGTRRTVAPSDNGPQRHDVPGGHSSG